MKKKWVYVAGSGVALILFLAIAFYVHTGNSMALDSRICEAVYALRAPGLTVFWKAVTYIANWQTITLICVVLLFFQKTRSAFGYPLAVSAILSSFVYKSVKEIFERPRPDLSLRLVEESGFSFPSGHSMTGLVFYALLIVLLSCRMKNKRAANGLTALVCCLILLIGVSRVYLGVHYPTDVLGGFCLGTSLLFLILLGKDAYKAAVKKDTL